MIVAGVDGCRMGWVVVLHNRKSGLATLTLAENFAAVIALTSKARIVAVDMPIGFPAAALPGGRACDREARNVLGPRQKSSVFSPPARAALHAANYPEALQINRSTSEHGLGLSKQAYNIFPKMREVDDAMTPTLQNRIKEVHPELCFIALNGGLPLPAPKKSPEGIDFRLQLLLPTFPEINERLVQFPRSVMQIDDILDAHAAAWTAARIADGAALRIPKDLDRDEKGLLMEIWR